MKIGLIGAENSHSRHFCEVINKAKKCGDAVITYLYGEDDKEEAKRLCDDFGIIACSSEDEVIEKSDAVVVTYRKGSAHYQPVIKALKAGKPVFNDKPFTTNLNEAKEIIALAKESGVLLTGGSSLKYIPVLEEIKKSIVPGSTAVISFSADPASEYEGYWFYGIHAVETCLTLFGLDFVSVQSFDNNVAVTNIAYSDKLCVLATAPKTKGLMISVSNAGKTVCYNVSMDSDKGAPEEFVEMVRSGKAPRDYIYYVKAVEIISKIIETAGM